MTPREQFPRTLLASDEPWVRTTGHIFFTYHNAGGGSGSYYNIRNYELALLHRGKVLPVHKQVEEVRNTLCELTGISPAVLVASAPAVGPQVAAPPARVPYLSRNVRSGCLLALFLCETSTTAVIF